MSHTITVRIPPDLADWLREVSERTGVPQGRIVRERLEEMRREDRSGRAFMRLAGAVDGPPDLSMRKGFSGGPNDAGDC